MGFLSKIEEKLAPSSRHEAEARDDGSHIGYTGQATSSGTGMVGGHSSNQPTSSSGVTSGLEHQAHRQGTASSLNSGSTSQGVSAKTAALMGHATSQNSDTPNLPGQFDSGSTSDRTHEFRHPVQTAAGRDFAASGPTTTTSTTTTTGTTAQYPTGGPVAAGSSNQHPSSSTMMGTAGSHSARHPHEKLAGDEYGSTGIGQTPSESHSLRHPGQHVASHEYSGVNPTTSRGDNGQAASNYSRVQGGNGHHSAEDTIGQATSDYSGSQGLSSQYQTGSSVDQASSGYRSGPPNNSSSTTGTGLRQTSTGQHGTSHSGVAGSGIGAAAAVAGYEASHRGHDDAPDRHGHYHTSDKVRANEPYDPYSTAGQKAAFDANSKSASDTSDVSQSLGNRSTADSRDTTTSSRNATGNSTTSRTGPRQALENKHAIPTAGGEKLGGATGPAQGYETRGGSTTGGSYADESPSDSRHRHGDRVPSGSAVTSGAGTHGPGMRSHQDEKPSMMDKMLHRTGHEESSASAHGQHDSHYGRDAAATGGVVALGAGAYESGKSSHREEKPSMMDKMLHRTGHEESPTGTHGQHDNHYGRDAAAAGGASALGAGAYESGKHGYREEKPSMMDKMLHRSGNDSGNEKTYASHDDHSRAHHSNTTGLTDRTSNDRQTHDRSHTGTGHGSTSISPQDISYMNPSSPTTIDSGRHDHSTSASHHRLGAGGALGGAALGFDNSSRNDPNDSTYAPTSGMGRHHQNTATGTKHDKTLLSGDGARVGQNQSSTTGVTRDHSGIGQHYQAGYEAGYQAGLRDELPRSRKCCSPAPSPFTHTSPISSHTYFLQNPSTHDLPTHPPGHPKQHRLRQPKPAPHQPPAPILAIRARVPDHVEHATREPRDAEAGTRARPARPADEQGEGERADVLEPVAVGALRGVEQVEFLALGRGRRGREVAAVRVRFRIRDAGGSAVAARADRVVEAEEEGAGQRHEDVPGSGALVSGR
nr:hypothetical protein CFP56_25837 [Quercus suber]